MELADAYAMAEDLIDYHALGGWSVVFDSAKARAGICRFAKREIGLSAPLTAIHSDAEVRDTILHEIAHALVGPAHGHDDVWRAVAQQIGCSGQRCVSTDEARVETAWLGVCPAGHSTGRHRRPERVMTCSHCSDRFDLDHLFTWTHHGRPAVHHPNYDAELDELRSGRVVRLVARGSRVRITAPGDFFGRVGKVVKHGRTCYHVRTGRETVRVPFAYAEPARRAARRQQSIT